MDFVESLSVVILSIHVKPPYQDEKSWITFGKGEQQRIVQGDISPLRFVCAVQKDYFADLAGASDLQYRELPGSFLEPDFESAGGI